MSNTICQRIRPKRVLLNNLLASLPIVNQQRPIRILVHHVNRPGNLQLFMVNRPLRPISRQMRILAQKVAKVLVFNAVVRHLHLIIITLNVIVHVRPGRRRRVAIRIPHIHDLPSGHLIILVLRVILVLPTAHNLLDYLVGIKLGKMVVVPRSHRHKRLVAMHRIYVCRLLKLNKFIAWMAVLFF